MFVEYQSHSSVLDKTEENAAGKLLALPGSKLLIEFVDRGVAVCLKHWRRLVASQHCDRAYVTLACVVDVRLRPDVEQKVTMLAEKMVDSSGEIIVVD